MNGTINDRYFEWLYAHVGSVRNNNPSRSYWNLLRKMYTTKFYWFVHNDDNRVLDALELRVEFLHRWGTEDVDVTWIHDDVSILEMLIALGRRAAYEGGKESADWFWEMVKNLELRDYTDAVYEISIEEEVVEVLQRLNDRKYERDGQGGLFPLKDARQDQRLVELRYQLSAYLLEGTFSDIRPK